MRTNIVDRLGLLFIGCSIGLVICILGMYWHKWPIGTMSIFSMALIGLLYISILLTFRKNKTTNKKERNSNSTPFPTTVTDGSDKGDNKTN